MQVNPVLRLPSLATAALLLALMALWARAVPLAPGVLTPLDGTSQAQRPELGEPVVPALLSPFELRQAGSGALRLHGTVGLALSTRPGSTGLVQQFRVAQLLDPAGEGFRVDALTMAPVANLGFPGDPALWLDADFRTDTPGQAAPAWALQHDGGLFGPVRFGFDVPLWPGQASHTIFLAGLDDLASYGSHGAFVSVSNALGESFDLPFASYVTFVPEPPAVWLVSVGAAWLAWRRRAARH